MPTPRQLIYALLLTSNWVGAAPRTDLPSISFSRKDWELACDNTRTCRAAGYHPEGDEPNATILLTRAAGPNQPVIIQLQLADDEHHPLPAQVRMSIAQRPVGTVRLDPKSATGTLSKAQAEALLPALLKDELIAWSANGTTWTISTAGANAVLLKMDEFQAGWTRSVHSRAREASLKEMFSRQLQRHTSRPAPSIRTNDRSR